MEEKKLTDEEIIDGLECCGNSRCEQRCFGYKMDGISRCINILIKNALDLIHRLQDENAGLKERGEIVINSLHGTIDKQKAEIERLTSLYDGKSGFMTSNIGNLPLTVAGLRKAVDEIARLYMVQAELQEYNEKNYNEAKDLRRKNVELQKQVDELKSENAELYKEHTTLIAGSILEKQDIAKDTAKEIFEKIFEALCCFSTKGRSDEYNKGYLQAIVDVDERIQKVAKEKGVEV